MNALTRDLDTTAAAAPLALPVRRAPRGLAGRARATGATVRDLLALSRERPWMLPLVLALLIASFLFVVVGIVEYAAPFVYTVF